MKPKPLSFDAFCRRYGFVLTPAQRVLSSVSFDGVEPADLGGEDRGLARRLFGEVDAFPEMARGIVAWRKGARVGGSRMSAMQLYRLAHLVRLDLAPGEAAYGIIVAPDLRLARQTMSFALGAARLDAAAGKIAIVRESADAFAFERHDGEVLTIECLPATAGGSAVRARTLFGAVMSEASFFRDNSGFVVNDEEIFRALVPRLTVPGAMVVVESTAWAAAGLLHELVTANHGAPSTCVAAIAPSVLMRPELAPLVERALMLDEDAARREYECVERSGSSEVFFDAVDACIDATLPARMVAPEGAIVHAGGDLGLVENSSALVVGATLNNVFVPLEILEMKPERGRPLKLSAVIDRFAGVLRSHDLSSFTADHHMIEPAREWAMKHGVLIKAVRGGPDAKAESYVAFRQAMREGRARLPNNPRLIAQLKSVRARALPGGGLKIETPVRAGAHGDIVSALVVAHAQISSGASRWIHALTQFQRLGGAEGLRARLGLHHDDLDGGTPWK